MMLEDCHGKAEKKGKKEMLWQVQKKGKTL